MREERPVKSKFLMKITYLRKEGEELKTVKSNSVWLRGKEFMEDMYEDRKNGINHKIEIVDREPEEKFQLGVIYILRTKDRAWAYQMDED